MDAKEFHAIFAEWVSIAERYGTQDHLPLTVLMTNGHERCGPVVITKISTNSTWEEVYLSTNNGDLTASRNNPLRILHGKNNNGRTMFLTVLE